MFEMSTKSKRKLLKTINDQEKRKKQSLKCQDADMNYTLWHLHSYFESLSLDDTKATSTSCGE